MRCTPSLIVLSSLSRPVPDGNSIIEGFLQTDYITFKTQLNPTELSAGVEKASCGGRATRQVKTLSILQMEKGAV